MRGKGEGSVFKDSRGFWTATVELPPLDGKRRRKVVRRKDKKVLLGELSKLRTSLGERGDLPTNDQTVAEWFTYWLSMQAREVRPKTFDGYRAVIKHIVAAIGKVKLPKVSAATVRRVYAYMGDKEYSSTYQLLAHRVMVRSFKDAVSEGRIGRNPAELVKAPRRGVPTLDVLTLDEALVVIKHAATLPDGARWIMHLLTGARRGEVLGLEVDRVTDTLDLSWQLQRLTTGAQMPADFEHRHLAGGLYLTRPKSRAGWRVIPLVDPLKSVLARHTANAEQNTWGLVFARPHMPFDPDQASKEWRRVLAGAGIEKNVRLHDLRHTAVDLLYMAGVPEDLIQEIVGHSSRSMTRDYKSRGNRERLVAAMESLSNLIQPESEPRELDA